MTRPGTTGSGLPEATGAARAAPSRFWLLVAGGIGALVLQAWLQSPEEMLWFGLPLFVLVTGAYRLLGSMPAEGALAVPPRPVGAIRKTFAIALVVLFFAGFAAIVWDRFHDSGFVGWLDALQMRHGGRYHEKESFVIAMSDLLIVYGMAMWAVLRIGRGS